MLFRRCLVGGICLLFAAPWLLQAGDPGPDPGRALKLITPEGYLPQIEMLVRVELLDSTGQRDRDVWDAEVTLSADRPGITLSTNRLWLRNGLGSAPLSFSGSGDFDLLINVGGLQTNRTIRSMAGLPTNAIAGTLPGSSTIWSGIILVTNDVIVPAGHTLTIQSNTWVLMYGVPSGTTAPDIFVLGNIQSLGTELQPVTITCVSNNLRFGEIRHTNAQPSLYRHTSISRGGRSAGVGHTSSFGGPLLRLINSRVVFENSNLTDNSGKIMNASGSDLVFDNCLMARAIMGPEINGTSLFCTNTWIMEMASNDDGDGIYLHSAGNRSLLLSRCVIAGLTGRSDDGIDTLDANLTLEDCIIRDWFHISPAEDPKGISGFNGTVRMRRCLVVDCFIGVASKSSSSSSTAQVLMDHCTVTGQSNAVLAAFKSNATNGNIIFRITNSILRSVDAVRSDFSPALTNFLIGYCNVSEAVSGTSNTVADPLFVDEAGNDFHLQPGSPCIDAGDPTFVQDPDGSRTEVGFFPFLRPSLSNPVILPDGRFQFIVHGTVAGVYRIQASSNFTAWETLTTLTNSMGQSQWTEPNPDLSHYRFYRAEAGP